MDVVVVVVVFGVCAGSGSRAGGGWRRVPSPLRAPRSLSQPDQTVGKGQQKFGSLDSS